MAGRPVNDVLCGNAVAELVPWLWHLLVRPSTPYLPVSPTISRVAWRYGRTAAGVPGGSAPPPAGSASAADSLPYDLYTHCGIDEAVMQCQWLSRAGLASRSSRARPLLVRVKQPVPKIDHSRKVGD
jgi:hypothetical protein